MNHPRRRQLLLALITLVTIGSTALVAAAGSKAPAAAQEWVASWATAMAGAGAGKSSNGFTNETIRMFVHTSVGGSQARIRLSNRFGTQPLTLAHATVGLPFGPNGGPGDLKPGSIKDVTFFGQRSLTVPVGGNAVSDAIDIAVPANQDIAVSLYFEQPTGPATWHLAARETTYFGPGNHAASASGAPLAETRTSWFFLSGLDVLNRNGKGAIAILGDSITDSFKSTVNADKRFSDLLSARLHRPGSGRRATVHGGRSTQAVARVGLLTLPVPQAAPLLLGAVLRKGAVAVRITEVEAYAGVGEDEASHAHNGPTKRNRVMFGPPGRLYVYFTYGMHWCANVVCGPEGYASAVLLRAGEVVDGVDIAQSRRSHRVPDKDLARGPARLTTVLAIDGASNGVDLFDAAAAVRLTPVDEPAPYTQGPRVGVAKAAQRPWRFWLPGEPTVSAYRRRTMR